MTRMREYEIVRAGIGRKFQTPSIYEDLTVFENLEIPSRVAGRYSAPWASAATPKSGTASRRSREHLPGRQLVPYAELLSHGQKQWLEIGMLLDSGPGSDDAGRTGRRHERQRAQEDRRAAAPA